MRLSRTALACGAAATLAGPVAPAGAAPKATVLMSKAQYAGGSIGGQPSCQQLCVTAFAVRPGERWVHVAGGSSQQFAAFDVKAADGYHRVCVSSKANGPFPVEGLKQVVVIAVLDDVACGVAPAAGTVVTYFSDRAVDYGTAVTTARPDPDRPVTGGIG